MLDDDQDAVAAEYVLGTLSDEERTHAEALLAVDPEFEMAVRRWERRLGELNVMVEAVEPPAEIWERIKTEIGPVAPVGETEAPAEHGGDEETLPPAPMLDDIFEPVAEHEVFPAAEEPHQGEAVPPPPPPRPEPPGSERSADVIYLTGRAARWQRVAYGLGALAAVLALYVAVGQIAPDLIPHAAKAPPRPDTTARAQSDRLVAVLQQGPTAPAFLLTLDTQSRTLTVRAVSAKPEPGKSYELWLVSKGGARSLGLIGNDEFTQSKIAANYDADTLRTATYAVSLEAAGGSKNDGPSGPILFTGKAIESLPAAPLQAPKT